MHGFIRNRLEDLLAKGQTQAESNDQNHHLASCPECASEFRQFAAQNELLRTLRAPEELDPSPGFYARVLQRIEERAKESIWAGLIYSPLSSRIAYVSLTLAVVLGSYVIASEARDGHLGGSDIVAHAHYDAPVVGSASQQRDAVLVNFAVH